MTAFQLTEQGQPLCFGFEQWLLRCDVKIAGLVSLNNMHFEILEWRLFPLGGVWPIAGSGGGNSHENKGRVGALNIFLPGLQGCSCACVAESMANASRELTTSIAPDFALGKDCKQVMWSAAGAAETPTASSAATSLKAGPYAGCSAPAFQTDKHRSAPQIIGEIHQPA